MCPKDADGMANRVDHDQTSPSGASCQSTFIPLVSEKCDVGFPKTIFSCLAVVKKVMLSCP